jgi:hypothetical protein
MNGHRVTTIEVVAQGRGPFRDVGAFVRRADLDDLMEIVKRLARSPGSAVQGGG